MKVGDRVVCVKGHYQSQCSLKKGAIYTIINIKECECGSVSFDVGIKGAAPFWRCSKCDERIFTEIWWLRSSRFAPIQFKSATAELLNNALIEEKCDVPIKETVN